MARDVTGAEVAPTPAPKRATGVVTLGVGELKTLQTGSTWKRERLARDLAKRGVAARQLDTIGEHFRRWNRTAAERHTVRRRELHLRAARRDDAIRDTPRAAPHSRAPRPRRVRSSRSSRGSPRRRAEDPEPSDVAGAAA